MEATLGDGVAFFCFKVLGIPLRWYNFKKRSRSAISVLGRGFKSRDNLHPHF